jgi:hypothetical protein
MLDFARWITARDYRAALMAAGFALLPLLAPLSCALLALVALQRGAAAGWRSGALGAALLAVVAWAAGAQPAAGLLSALMIWAPTLAVVQILTSSGSLSVAIRLAATGAIVLAGTWSLAAPVSGEPWLGMVAEVVAPLAGQTGTDAELLAGQVLAILPGIIAVSLLLMSVIGLFLAMWLHAGMTAPGAFGEAFRALQLGPVLGGVAALALVAATFGAGTVAWAVALPAGTALLLQGIAVMHAMVRMKAMSSMWLFGGWTALILLWPWGLLGFACYGLADTLLDLRRRAAGGT